MGVSLTSQLVTLVHVTEKRWNSGYTDIRIYVVDVSTPAMSLWTNFRIPHIIEPICLNCDLLAVPWIEIATGRMNILVASLSNEEEVLMDLGIRDEELHNFTIHIISQQLLILARPTEFFLFSIPDREKVDESGHPRLIPVQPIWTYSHHVRPVRGRPFISSLAYTDSNQYDGKVAILTGKFIYILSTSDRPEDCHVLHYALPGDVRYAPFRAAMGSRHAIWTEERSVRPFVGLQTCAYFIMPDGYGGLQRLGHVGQLGVQLRSLQLPIQCGDVVDVSFDEESSRLCALISQMYNGAAMNRILFVDLA